jgi:hypothetical protein
MTQHTHRLRKGKIKSAGRTATYHNVQDDRQLAYLKGKTEIKEEGFG